MSFWQPISALPRNVKAALDELLGLEIPSDDSTPDVHQGPAFQKKFSNFQARFEAHHRESGSEKTALLKAFDELPDEDVRIFYSLLLKLVVINDAVYQALSRLLTEPVESTVKPTEESKFLASLRDEVRKEYYLENAKERPILPAAHPMNFILGRWVAVRLHALIPDNAEQQEKVIAVLLHFSSLGAFYAFKKLCWLSLKHLDTLSDVSTIRQARKVFKQYYDSTHAEDFYGQAALHLHIAYEKFCQKKLVFSGEDEMLHEIAASIARLSGRLASAEPGVCYDQEVEVLSEQLRAICEKSFTFAAQTCAAAAMLHL